MLKRSVYDQDHEIYRAAVRKFLEKEAVPHHDAWEEAGITPKDFWRKAGAQGLLCPQVPEQYGGSGADYRYLAVVNEEAGLLGISAVNFQVHSDIAAAYVLNYGTEAAKKRLLPRMVAGEAIGAIVMTEPDTGSDLQAIKTSAVRRGDHYVLNGAKTFISNGINASVLIVAAKTDPSQGARGISLFIVEDGMTGFERGQRLKKLGLKGQDTAELFFNDVAVPADNLLGQENRGFALLMQELPQERLAIAVVAVAASQRAFDLTLAYVRERKAFKQRLMDFQNTRFVLAGLKAELAAAWAYLDQGIVAHTRGELAVPDAAALKLWTTELQGRVMDQCLQLFGGYGYMWEYPIARLFADARIQRIYGGTSEIMKEIIARDLDRQ